MNKLFIVIFLIATSTYAMDNNKTLRSVMTKEWQKQIVVTKLVEYEEWYNNECEKKYAFFSHKDNLQRSTLEKESQKKGEE